MKRGKWRPFEEARKFAHSLVAINTLKEWVGYARSGKLPNDIPRDPRYAYKNKGWKGMGDWLGTGYVATFRRQYLSLAEVKDFARSLKIKTQHEWRKYCKVNKLPDNIPANPDIVYKKQGTWKNWGDFLGTKNRKGGWLSYEKAREFIRKLGLKDKDAWDTYCKSGKKPVDIPTRVYLIYNGKGWNGIGDFLGTGRVANKDREYRSIEEARKFAARLGLKNKDEWADYVKLGKLPNDIPRDPPYIYKKQGTWKGWGDFLGSGNIANQDRKFMSFSEAKKLVQKLGIKTQIQYGKFSKSGKKPNDLPSLPSRTYKKEWKGWGDYLGTGRIANQDKEYLSPIEAKIEARKYQKKLGIKTQKDWEIAYKSGKIPSTLPASLWNTYGRQRRKRK